MPDITVVYWRDIPALVLVGRGRAAVKRLLPERCEQAIDRAATKAGMAGTDAYFAQWHRLPGGSTDRSEAADSAARRIDTEYDADRLRRLIDNCGLA